MIYDKKWVGKMAVLIGFLVFFACTHDHSDHDHGAHSPRGEAASMSGDKMVHLNAAQFQNAEIDTGWFALKNLTEVIRANGYTKLDPQHEAEVSLPVSGTIKSIHVIEGNYVKKGQVVATMTSLELNEKLFQREKLREQLAGASAEKKFLDRELSRQEKLASENISASKSRDRAASEFEIAEAKISALQKQISLLTEALAMVGDITSGSLPILTPIAGYINEIHFKLGSTVRASDPMFSIVDNSKMHVDLLVYEKDLPNIKVGQKVRFTLSNQSNQELSGEIYNIGKSFASDTKSVAVHADLEPNDLNLIPGMYLNALIDIGDNSVRAVPEDAIVLSEGRSFIFIMEPDHHDHDDDHHDADAGVHDAEEYVFSRLEVKTGAKQLGYVGVIPLADIHDGDRIVLGGAYYLQSHLQKMDGGGGHSH